MRREKAYIFFDGASTPHSHTGASCGYVITSARGTLAVGRPLKPNSTNNEAEWAGLIEALKRAHLEGFTEVEIRGDSMLVVNSVLGKYKIKKPHLKPLYAEAYSLLSKFKLYSIHWIPREENDYADKMCRLVRGQASQMVVGELRPIDT